VKVLEPRAVAGDPAAAEALNVGTEVLASWLAKSDRLPRERLALWELRVRCLAQLEKVDEAFDLAYRLIEPLRSRGQAQRAAQVVESVLGVMPADHAYRPFLLVAHAELARHQGNLQTAEERFELASNVVASKSVTAETRLALEPALMGLWTQIQLDRGLIEQAAASNASELDSLRKAQQQGYVDISSWVAAFLRQANVRYAYGRYDAMIEELDRALEFLDGLDDPKKRLPLWRPQLELRRALALLDERHQDASLTPLARDALQSIWDAKNGSSDTRLVCATRLGELAIGMPDLETGRKWLAAARALEQDVARTGIEVDQKECAYLAALEARLALRSGETSEVLAGCADRLKQELDRLLASWLAQPPRKAGLGFLRYDRTRTIVGELLTLQAALDEEGGAERALSTLHRAGAASSLYRFLDAQRLEPAELPTLDRIKEALLPGGIGALVYFPFADRSLIFTLDAEHGVELHVGASERILADAGRKWTAEMVLSPDGLDAARLEQRKKTLAQHGQTLADALLPPSVRARMQGWTAVTIVGSEYVNDLPFEALPYGKSYLGLDLGIGYLPSLPIGVLLSERTRASSPPEYARDLCLVAGIKGHDPKLQDLPLGESQREKLLAPFEDERVLALLGEGATLDALRDADLSSVRMLHFVTHGIDDLALERPQGLMLSKLRALWCDDAEDLAAPPLVVISACSAGRGPAREGDGPVATLGGAFLLGGAECVVLSNARLAYEPTLSLVSWFQRELQSGARPCEALLLARQRVQAAEDTRDPFYWAHVRALGLAIRPVFAP
jgi:hypothetical protein